MSANQMRRLSSLLLVSALIACANSSSSHDVRRDSYEIYGAVLDSFAPATSGPIAVGSRTWPYALSRALGDTSALYRGVRSDTGVGAALLDAYDRANQRDTLLCECFSASSRVQLVDHQLRPDVPGPIMLSAIGFDSRRSRALVAASRVCGPLCGSSAVYLVVRQPTGWRVQRRLLVGAS